LLPYFLPVSCNRLLHQRSSSSSSVFLVSPSAPRTRESHHIARSWIESNPNSLVKTLINNITPISQSTYFQVIESPTHSKSVIAAAAVFLFSFFWAFFLTLRISILSFVKKSSYHCCCYFFCYFSNFVSCVSHLVVVSFVCSFVCVCVCVCVCVMMGGMCFSFSFWIEILAVLRIV
jgi:hypothetical protein